MQEVDFECNPQYRWAAREKLERGTSLKMDNEIVEVTSDTRQESYMFTGPDTGML